MSWEGIKTQLGEVYDAYADPIKDRLEPKPFSVEELKEKLKNKEIGTEWYNQEIRKLNALKDLVPEKRQEQIASGLSSAGQAFNRAWEGAETVENWYDPFDVGAAGVANTVNVFNQGVGLLSQGVAAVVHHGLRVDKRASNLAGNVASVALTKKLMSGTSNLLRSGQLQQATRNILPTSRLNPASKQVIKATATKVSGPGITAESSKTIARKYPWITGNKPQPYAFAYDNSQGGSLLKDASRTTWDGINRVGPDSKYVLPGETYYTPFGPYALKSNVDSIPKIDTSLNKLVLNRRTTRETLYSALDTDIAKSIDPRHLTIPIDTIIDEGFAMQLGLRQGAGSPIAGKLPGLVQRRDKLSAIPEETRSAGLDRDPLKGAQKNVKTNFRNLRDLFSLNLLTKHKDIFKINRRGIKDALVTFKVGDKEWHHTFFGNKEGGKLFLNKVAQDPVLAINIMAKLQELKLPTSGVVENLALIEKAEGTVGIGHNKLHNIFRELGLEQGGALDFSEIVDAVAEAYLAGDETAINHFFTLLEVYAERTAPRMAQETLKAGGVMFKDTGVEKLTSVQKYNPKSTKFRN